jgi:hypothetical protein
LPQSAAFFNQTNLDFAYAKPRRRKVSQQTLIFLCALASLREFPRTVAPQFTDKKSQAIGSAD